MRRARVSVACLCLAIALSAAAPGAAPAQSAYPAANGPSSIVPRSTGFVRADFAEANLSLQFLHEALDAGLGLGAWAGAAARAGQVDMFAEFDFNPGFEGGVLAFKSLGGGARSLDVIALSVGYQSTQRKLAAFTADSTSVTLSELRREWSSPGVAPSAEVCVETSSPGGIVIPLCESRYLVELADYWAGQLRVDLLWAVARLGGARSQPHLAVMGSSSVDLGQDAAARWNISGGIGVAPLEYPGQVIVALLIGVYDLSDANEQGLDFGDRLVTRLVLGIPFDLLLN